MGVSLSKGQTISLAKPASGAGLKKVFMGLGWDPVKKKGFLGRIMSSDEIDLDASVIVFDAQKKVLDTVWFRQLRSADGSIRHGGDNLTGEGDGDDEVIYVDLEKLSPAATHLVFTVNSFRGQTFNDVDNAFARLVDEDTGEELCKYELTEKGAHTGVIMATLAKTADGWAMTAHGAAAAGRTVNDMAAAAKSLI